MAHTYTHEHYATWLGYTSIGGVGESQIRSECPGSGGSRSGPTSFNPLRRGWVYRLVLEAPLFKKMLTEPEAFLKLTGASGLRSCAKTLLKRPCAKTLLKRPCATLVRLVGCMTNSGTQVHYCSTISSYRSVHALVIIETLATEGV